MYTFKKVLCPILYGAGLRRSTASQPKKLPPLTLRLLYSETREVDLWQV